MPPLPSVIPARNCPAQSAPPCQFSAPHLASVARAESVVGTVSGGQSSSAAPAPLLLQETWPHFAGTTLHTAACQPPTPSSPLTARNIKVSGQLPHASEPTSISTGSGQPAIGYLATVSSFPSCIVIAAAALIPQPAHSDKPLTASQPITNTYWATGRHLFTPSNESRSLTEFLWLCLSHSAFSFHESRLSFPNQFKKKFGQIFHPCNVIIDSQFKHEDIQDYHLITTFLLYSSPP